jgi:flagellar biosynthesis protein
MSLSVKGYHDYKCAVGLAYNPHCDDAPIVCVKGDGIQADEIVRLAKRYGIPIVEKGEIAEILSDVQIDETIPEDIYEAVALILSELKSFKR